MKKFHRPNNAEFKLNNIRAISKDGMGFEGNQKTIPRMLVLDVFKDSFMQIWSMLFCNWK